MKKNTDSDKNIKEKIKGLLSKVNKENISIIWGNHKKKVVCCLIVGFLFIGYFIGTPTNNREEVVEKLKSGLETGNVNKLTNIIKVNGEKVSKKELEPLNQYFLERSADVSDFVNLVSNGKSKVMDVKKEKVFLGENYYIDLKTFDIKITSNLKNTNITLNDRNIEEGKVISGILPGEYDLVAKVDTNYGVIKETGEISILDNTNLNLELKGDNITVKSEYKDATVLVNGVSSGKTVEEFKEIGPMPMDGSVAISIEKEFPWGKIEGPKVTVKNNVQVKVALDMENDELWSNVETGVDSFYKSVFLALTNENKEEIKEATPEAKTKIYNVLEKNYLFLKNKYELKEIKIDKEKSEFKYKDGVYSGSVVCDVNYTISKDIFGILGIQTSEENKKFFTKVIYKKGKWIVSDIENFSL
ncbi:MAG: TcaA 3rd/4th domain-containing protein [Clostridium sp.]|uniref:TcaA 3rd/4th domain-containing protein n=1 Tax=Clostridium sp. TaxID=1506 RepID=UPI003F3626AE